MRSPLRVSLGGGGTDLPSYYCNHGGFLIAAAIDKYINAHRRFVEGFLLKYSHLEEVATIVDRWPGAQPFDLADVYRRLAVQKQLAGYEVKQRFYEVASPEVLEELDSILRSQPAFVLRT